MSSGSILVDAAVVCAAVIVDPLPVGLPRHLRCRGCSRAACASASPPSPGSSRPSSAWTGMRGAVSLAAALAIPQTIDGGGDFPQRDLIVFLTYAVILVTLILQGLTLPGLIKVLDVEDDGNLEQRESKARILAARAALDRIEELREQDWVRDDTADRMRGIYDFRIRRFSARFDDEDDGAHRRAVLRLPAPAAQGARGRARRDHPPAQRGQDQRRDHAPPRARPRPRGHPSRGLTRARRARPPAARRCARCRRRPGPSRGSGTRGSARRGPARRPAGTSSVGELVPVAGRRA